MSDVANSSEFEAHLPRNWRDPQLRGELIELETQLASLIPRSDRLNRDRIMFAAGQAFAETTAISHLLSQLRFRHRVIPSLHVYTVGCADRISLDDVFSNPQIDSSLPSASSNFVSTQPPLTAGAWDQMKLAM